MIQSGYHENPAGKFAASYSGFFECVSGFLSVFQVFCGILLLW